MGKDELGVGVAATIAALAVVVSLAVPGAMAYHDRVREHNHHTIWNGTDVPDRTTVRLTIELNETSECTALGGATNQGAKGETSLIVVEHDGERRGWAVGARNSAVPSIHVGGDADTRTVGAEVRDPDGRSAVEAMASGSFSPGTHTVTVAGEDLETWPDFRPALSIGFGCEDPFTVVERAGGNTVEIFSAGSGQQGVGVKAGFAGASVEDAVEVRVDEDRGEVWRDGLGYGTGIIDVTTPDGSERWRATPSNTGFGTSGPSGDYVVEPTSVSTAGFSWMSILGHEPLDSFDELEE
jgi:hypothetical protein